MTNEIRSAQLKNWMLDYGKLVYSVAYRILMNAQDAEDVFQNTFSKAYFKMSRLKTHDNIKAWLCQTARNDALNKLASSWKTKVELIEAPREIAPAYADSTEIAYLVKRLPLPYRQCIWLFYYAGYKSEEIAEILEIPHGTVRTRLRRARAHLKEQIQEIHGGANYEY